MALPHDCVIAKPSFALIALWLAAFADGDGWGIGRNGVDAPLIEPAYDAGPFESRRPIIAALRFNEAPVVRSA